MVRLKEYENIYSLDLEKEETHEEEDFVHSFVPSEVFLETSGQRFSVNAVKCSMTKLFNRKSIRRREFCSS